MGETEDDSDLRPSHKPSPQSHQLPAIQVHSLVILGPDGFAYDYYTSKSIVDNMFCKRRWYYRIKLLFVWMVVFSVVYRGQHILWRCPSSQQHHATLGWIRIIGRVLDHLEREEVLSARTPLSSIEWWYRFQEIQEDRENHLRGVVSSIHATDTSSDGIRNVFKNHAGVHEAISDKSTSNMTVLDYKYWFI